MLFNSEPNKRNEWDFFSFFILAKQQNSIIYCLDSDVNDVLLAECTWILHTIAWSEMEACECAVQWNSIQANT